MKAEHFRLFLFRTHPVAAKSLTNELTDGIGKFFWAYLTEKLEGAEKADEIMDIRPHIVADRCFFDPFSIMGYHPALIIHFENFIQREEQFARDSGLCCPTCNSINITKFTHIHVCGDCKHKWLPKR